MRIAASKVAAAAGLHPYCSRDDVYAVRDSKELAAIRESAAASGRAPEQALATLRTECSLVASEASPGLLDEKERLLLESVRGLCTDEGDAEVLRSFVKSSVATHRGDSREREDLLRFARDLRPGVLAARPLDIDGFSVRIAGIPDAMDSGGNVVETKHRRRGLFGLIPEYERIQLEVYMWLTGTSTCTHIENYDGAWNATVYAQDSDLWERVVSGLREYVASRREGAAATASRQ